MRTMTGWRSQWLWIAVVLMAGMGVFELKVGNSLGYAVECWLFAAFMAGLLVGVLAAGLAINRANGRQETTRRAD